MRPRAMGKAAALALAIGSSVAAVGQAGDPALRWAFPEGKTASAGDGKTRPLHLPGTSVTFTAEQTRDHYAAADWYPKSHPPMPSAVARGRPPGMWACGYCHLPAGEGRPENASLAGLPRDYIVAQTRAFAHGSRKGTAHAWLPTSLMADNARHATDAEVEAAAAYFSALPYISRVRVVETATVRSPRALNYLFVPVDDAAIEPLGERIVEVPVSFEHWERRDPRVTYLAYVPPGSLKRGAELARGKAGLPPCATCHGEGLRGGGLGPPIAGRSPSYQFRQLYAFKAGARSGPDAAPMQAVAQELSVADMIAVAAYAASLH